jgi:uncharacterized membrane protein YedE/YeeE
MHVSQIREFSRFLERANRREARLVVVDPRYSVAASKAWRYLPARPGTDMALILAWIHMLLHEGDHQCDPVDVQYLEAYAYGLPELKEHFKPFTPEWTYPYTGIEPSVIREIAHALEKKIVEKPYLNPYFAGILLGLLLLVTFFVSGRGLGASGAFSKVVAYAVHPIAPQHAENQPYLKRYFAHQEGFGHDNWLLVEVLGILLGGFLSGFWSRQLREDVERGPNIKPSGRIALAFSGGVLIGFAARLARGCTSGQGLAGGAMMSLGYFHFLFPPVVTATVTTTGSRVSTIRLQMV